MAGLSGLTGLGRKEQGTESSLDQSLAEKYTGLFNRADASLLKKTGVEDSKMIVIVDSFQGDEPDEVTPLKLFVSYEVRNKYNKRQTENNILKVSKPIKTESDIKAIHSVIEDMYSGTMEIRLINWMQI